MCKIDGSWEATTQHRTLSPVLCDDLDEWLGQWRGGEMCILMAGGWASLVAQMIKNPPAMQETWVRALVRKIPGEGNGRTHSSILAGESHGQRSLTGSSPLGRRESDMTEQQQATMADSHCCATEANEKL